MKSKGEPRACAFADGLTTGLLARLPRDLCILLAKALMRLAPGPLRPGFCLGCGLMLVAAKAECVAAPALVIGQNFTGSQFGVDSDAIPPDANGAVGPSHFVEFINGRYSVYDKSSGRRLQTMRDVSFWTNSGVQLGRGLDVTDPRLVFDADAQRWYASAIEISPSVPRLSRNRFLFAVSAGADPSGAWHGFGFVADPVYGDAADFPTMGVDKSGVYLAADMSTASLGLHVGSALVALPKAGLLADHPTIDNRIAFGILPFNSYGQILQPAVTIGNASPGESILAVGNMGSDDKPHSNLFLANVEDGSATNSRALVVPEYAMPNGLDQPDGSTNLDAGDARISGAAQRVGDLLYGVHTIANGTHSAVRWYRIDARQMTLLQSGTIAASDLDLSYPSIAANEAGTVVIACNGSGLHSFMSCYAVPGETVNGVLSFGERVLLKAGLASYQALDPSGISRWGDYSATTVDPNDPSRFWTIQTFPIGARAWATEITELLTAVPLSIAVTGADLEISWPDTEAQLQFTSELPPLGTWLSVPQAPVIRGGRMVVTLPIAAAQRFFRLTR